MSLLQTGPGGLCFRDSYLHQPFANSTQQLSMNHHCSPSGTLNVPSADGETEAVVLHNADLSFLEIRGLDSP